jgi:hypothetical protein
MQIVNTTNIVKLCAYLDTNKVVKARVDERPGAHISMFFLAPNEICIARETHVCTEIINSQNSRKMKTRELT